MYQWHRSIRSGKVRASSDDLECEPKQFTIQDHNDDEVRIAWRPKTSWFDGLPPFPFQVYFLSSAGQVINDSNFPVEFADFVQSIGGVHAECNCHFQVYTRPFPNILACVTHQKQEIRHRNRNGIVPRMIASRVQGTRTYNGHIIVIDTEDWTKEGPISVKYDPTEYENPREFSHWNVAGPGDVDVVHASRYRSGYQFNQELVSMWSHAGGQWSEGDLARRNDGGGSPVLYPAIDPAAHHDAEDEKVDELDEAFLPEPTAYVQDYTDENVPVGPPDDLPRIIRTFDPEELFKMESEMQDVRSEMYMDDLGLPVTSLWSSKLSRTRPQLSITLYLAFDFLNKLPIHPKALFGCLNPDLLSKEPWTLDIINNMPSIDAAFQYHARATSQRTAKRVAKRRSCMRDVLHQICGDILPSEIREQIEDILVPPEIPTYSARPCRPFKDVFLYLDKSHQYTGPLIVYSHRDIFYHVSPWTDIRSDEQTLAEQTLRVVFLRYWHRVSDELHTLWSLCSPRNTDVDDLSLPEATLELTAPEVCVWRTAFGAQCINGYADIKFKIQTDRLMTIHCGSGPFSHKLWYEAVEVIDLETNEILPSPPYCQEESFLPKDSWSQSIELGFNALTNGSLNPMLNFKTFDKDYKEDVSIAPDQPWWRYLVHNGFLKSGGRYAFKLKRDIPLTIPRWTYGKYPKLDGPFNLPPIPVTVDDTLHPFKFRVESVGAPNGSFISWPS